MYISYWLNHSFLANRESSSAFHPQSSVLEFISVGLQMRMERFLFLCGVAAFLLGRCIGSFLQHLYLGVSEEHIQGLSWFSHLGYLDDQLITRYDSNTRRVQPQVPWMEKAEDALYWERETHHAREAEYFFKVALATMESRYNQSGGLHTWQCLVGCELSEDRKQKGRFMQWGYDGKDFISLDNETFTWRAVDDASRITKRKWEADPDIAKYWKPYLEEECIEKLKKYLDFEKETLLRTEPHIVIVAHKVGQDGLETVICRAFSFYPKEINATWMKDGLVLEKETLRGDVLPNSDGTYHTWLSTEIDPKDRDHHYHCHVEHDSLQKPLDLAWADSGKWQRKRNTYKLVQKERQQDVSQTTQEAASSDGPRQQEEGSLSLPSLDLSDHLPSNCKKLHLSMDSEDTDRASPTMSRHEGRADSGDAYMEVAGGIPASTTPVLSHNHLQIISFPSSSTRFQQQEEEEEAEKEVMGRSISSSSSSDFLSLPLLPSHPVGITEGRTAARSQARQPGKRLSLQLLPAGQRLWRDLTAIGTHKTGENGVLSLPQ
ncbi:hereditary hemochromatosis protein homolog isoform X2 [Hemicordylus capensis]|uniref:hereditary hemochromatosis protein homolog isoform X2 n=1 Tax=Hemicordylus capensis TaxID=884348 RepID=UPI002302C5DA|nr:hereditary hemochromatosis protein homolog isoform X2 [Hemicordylus capensis]